jgi:short-subunit dehydrogenase
MEDVGNGKDRMGDAEFVTDEFGAMNCGKGTATLGIFRGLVHHVQGDPFHMMPFFFQEPGRKGRIQPSTHADRNPVFSERGNHPWNIGLVLAQVKFFRPGPGVGPCAFDLSLLLLYILFEGYRWEVGMKIERELTALVTGASSGIGFEIAHELASRKIHLILVSRSRKKLESLAQDLEKRHGIRTFVMPADLSRPGEAERLFQACTRKKLAVDILVNNAGVGLFGLANEQDLERTVAMIQLNVVSLTVLSILFSRQMKERGRGYILNVGSLVGHMPVPFFAAYSATKAYVRSFSFSHRTELGPFGVSVTNLEPGFVRTNFDKAADATHDRYAALSAAGGMSARSVAKLAVKALLGRKAVVVAGFHNWLASKIIYLLPKRLIAAMIHAMIKRILGRK